MTQIDENDLCNIFCSYFKYNSVISHQLDSFSEFINYYLPAIINNTVLDITHKNNSQLILRFSNTFLDKPKHFDIQKNKVNIISNLSQSS